VDFKDSSRERLIGQAGTFFIEKKFVPVMITPYDLKAKVDLDVVSRLIDFYLAAGVKGFFANCLSSEMFSISEDERLQLTKHIVDYVNEAVPVVATGSFGLTIEEKAEFTKKIYDTGIKAVIMITGCSGLSRWISANTSMPFLSGRARSSRTNSCYRMGRSKTFWLALPNSRPFPPIVCP